MKLKVIFSIGVLSVFMCNTASAMQWMVMPTFNMSLFHDDNYLMNALQPTETSGSITTLGFGVSRHMENTKMSIQGNLIIRDFSNARILDINDEQYSAGYSHSTERQSFGLDVSSIKAMTSIFELGTNGSVLTTKQSVKTSHQPSWTYLITDTDSLIVNYSHTDIDYDALATELADNHFELWSVSFKRRFSEKNTFSLLYSRSDNQVPDIGIIGLPGVETRTVTNSIFTEFHHQFSETFSAAYKIGVRKSIQKTIFIPLAGNPIVKSEDDSPLFSFDVSKKYETSSVSLKVSRALVPSGNGSLNKNDSFDLGLQWQITDRSSANIKVSVLTVNPEDSNTNLNRFQYLSIEPRYNKRFNLSWNFSTYYRYREQSFNRIGSNAFSRALFLSLSYIPDH